MNKTTINYAKRRDMDVTIAPYAVGSNYRSVDMVEIWSGDNDMEPEVLYRVNDDGTYTLYTRLNWDLEDMPLTIWNEQGLRRVIDYIAAVTH